MRAIHDSRSPHWNEERKANEVYSDVARSREIKRRQQMNDENSQQGFENEQAGGIKHEVNQIEQ